MLSIIRYIRTSKIWLLYLSAKLTFIDVIDPVPLSSTFPGQLFKECVPGTRQTIIISSMYKQVRSQIPIPVNYGYERLQFIIILCFDAVTWGMVFELGLIL